jgi:hypothetical protein
LWHWRRLKISFLKFLIWSVCLNYSPHSDSFQLNIDFNFSYFHLHYFFLSHFLAI